MSRLLRLASLGALLGAVFSPQAARAEFPSPAPYIGINGGISSALRAWDLGTGPIGTDGQAMYPGKNTTGLVGLRLGLHVHSMFAVEAELGYLPLKGAGGTNTLLAYDLNLLVHFLSGNYTPTLSLGFGGYSNTSGKLGKDTDPRGHAGLGFRGLVLPWMAVRADVRAVFTDGFTTPGALNLEATVGLDFFLWRPTPKPVVKPIADRDHDGIPDSEDACPDEPGPAATKGCPDKDHDGIPDKDDACPNEPGPAATKGCPDKDGDGVIDKEDRCPNEPGPAALKGCPDKDGDGVPDIDDRCPNEPGPVELKGCPDRDGDGVPDIDDKCPDVPGLPEFQGCLPPKAQKFTGAIKGINFATGSAKILPNSFKILDGAVAVLKEFGFLRLRIEGHTDNVGKPAKNQTLSQARAESVRDYFVKKGIAADRFHAVGFGDTKPVGDNKTKAGKAQNRRIEFTAISSTPK